MKHSDDMLAKLHALRRLDPDAGSLYWALTLAIDILLGCDVDADIERVAKYRAEEQERKP